jgi:hypothetical protein
MPHLELDCDAEGCGGDDVPLVIIAEPHEAHRLRDDGSVWPEMNDLQLI